MKKEEQKENIYKINNSTTIQTAIFENTYKHIKVNNLIAGESLLETIKPFFCDNPQHLEYQKNLDNWINQLLNKGSEEQCQQNCKCFLFFFIVFVIFGLVCGQYLEYLNKCIFDTLQNTIFLYQFILFKMYQGQDYDNGVYVQMQNQQGPIQYQQGQQQQVIYQQQQQQYIPQDLTNQMYNQQQYPQGVNRVIVVEQRPVSGYRPKRGLMMVILILAFGFTFGMIFWLCWY